MLKKCNETDAYHCKFVLNETMLVSRAVVSHLRTGLRQVVILVSSALVTAWLLKRKKN